MNFSDMIFGESTHLKRRSGGQVWAIVVDNEDPEGFSRIKVRLPWHTETQSTDWISRLSGGGRGGYGSNMGVPQPGETVGIYFINGNQHHPVYQDSSWTPGGKGPLGQIPASLPPTEHKTNPRHDPANGKFKVWFWKSLSGFLLRMGEGLDWLQFKTPKGYDFRLEHDVPVDGMTKDDAVENGPFHRLNLQTPTGHTFTVLEHKGDQINDISVKHVNGMSVELLSESGQRTVRLQVDGYKIEISKGDTNSIRMMDESGQFIELSPDAGLHNNAGLIYDDAAKVMLGTGASISVARVGDTVQVSGVMPGSATVTGIIVTGSDVVKSA